MVFVPPPPPLPSLPWPFKPSSFIFCEILLTKHFKLRRNLQTFLSLLMSYCIAIMHCLFPCTCNNKKLRFCPQTLSSHNKLIWQDKTRTKLWQGWGVHNHSNFLPGLPKDDGWRTSLLHDCHSSKDHSITTKQPCLCNILTEFPLPPLQWLKAIQLLEYQIWVEGGLIWYSREIGILAPVNPSSTHPPANRATPLLGVLPLCMVGRYQLP